MAGIPRDLLDELQGALGGAERIASVTTYARDAVVRLTSAPRPGAASSGEFGVRLFRELTFRAAGGRLRIERLSEGTEDGAREPTPLAIAGPEVRHAHGSLHSPHSSDSSDSDDSSPHGLHGSDAPGECIDRREPAGAELGAPTADFCSACAGERALAEARLEPRNLLAHAAERGAAIRTTADGAIAMELAAEGLFYRFDRRTRLCDERIDRRLGVTTVYREWTGVDGIMTPFRELESRPEGSTERRVLAAAYDLPWPPVLFQPL